MDGAMTLENNERRQGLGRPGTCGASISVWTGDEKNITVKAGFMGNIFNNVESNEGTDVVEANWLLVRDKKIYINLYQ